MALNGVAGDLTWRMANGKHRLSPVSKGCSVDKLVSDLT